MASLVDSILYEPITILAEQVIQAGQTTTNFKPELKRLGATLERIILIIDMLGINWKPYCTEESCNRLKDEIEEAAKLVEKCLKVKRNVIKKLVYSLKLENFRRELLGFFQIELEGIQTWGIDWSLLRVDLLRNRIMESNHGWRVPALPSGIVAFDEPLAKLKAVVVADIYRDGREVVVVAGAGGCGKTTLVKMLCHDARIRGIFRKNIFFVTVSETPNIMVIANDLFNANSSSLQILIQSNEDARNKLEQFLNPLFSSSMLLVLDDVWSGTFIENFPYNKERCKILVTSRIAFPKYNAFIFEPLNQEDAKSLFRQSAFTKGGKKPNPVIDENL